MRITRFLCLLLLFPRFASAHENQASLDYNDDASAAAPSPVPTPDAIKSLTGRFVHGAWIG
jgi:hypothetical protein